MSFRTRKEIANEIRELTTESGFPYTFAHLVRRYLFFDPDEIADTNWQERLTSKEFAFVGGLMVSCDFSLEQPTGVSMLAQSRRLERLLEELHDAHSEWRKGAATQSRPSVAEPIFYGADGAYDFQYLQFARRKYAGDYSWFRENVGFDPDFAESFARYLKRLVEMKANTKRVPTTQGELCDLMLETFCFRMDELHDFDADLVRAFLDKFSLTPGSVNKNLELPGQFNELDARPIIKLRGRPILDFRRVSAV